MGSRIREDVENLYLCFCEVARPESMNTDAWIIQKFPDTYMDDHILKSVPRFTFPCEFENTNVQHFSFVLTDLDSKWTFGFCRHDPKTETALVFLSHLPWHEVFVKVLNSVAELIRSSVPEELDNFLYILLQSKVPLPGTTLSFSYNNGQNVFECQSPSQFQLPKIPQNRNLTEYYNAVDISNMLVIFASMLYERRIIFVSKKLYRLSACVQAANSIIYPMHWQHIFIPVLPKHLCECLLAPMPFLIGVPASLWENVHKSDIGDVVVLDADNNSIQTPFSDVDSLPQDVVKFLRSQLKNRSALIGDGFARVFLKALVQLIGGYRDALKLQQGQKITFSQEAFVESRPANMQPFLKDMLHLQIFQQFIDERLDLLNSGMGFSDEFEFEACNYSEKSSSKIKAQYKEWVSTMRSQGTAFFKTVKSKANPAVKSAVKSVKERGKDVKTAYRGIRLKVKREADNFREHANIKASISKPRSAPSSPTSHRTRPISFGNLDPIAAASTFKKQKRFPAQTNRFTEYVSLSPQSDEFLSPSDADTTGKVDIPSLNMDLMGDLQEVINRQCTISERTEVESFPSGYRIPNSEKRFNIFDEFEEKELPNVDLMTSGHSIKHAASFPMVKPSPTSNSFTHDFEKASQQIESFPFNSSSNSSFIATTAMNPFYPDLIQTSFKYNTKNPFVVTPPAQARVETKMEKCNGSGSVGDLIRLDSIPKEESFDPLDRTDSDETIAFPQGLINPLYPYFKVNGVTDDNSVGGTQPQQEQGKEISSNTSFLHRNSHVLGKSNFNKQDLELLKEYGMDFRSSNTTDLTKSVGSVPPTSDPFELAFQDSTIIKKKSNWATFE
ncbi:hypothetical protein RUM44_009715 [Polyplax serrata]|uniref:UDENN domain-containing protein n=1 Tax=Polyplax serrata TaxID=468196 RepID=A0ABR1ATG7_POLSC